MVLEGGGKGGLFEGTDMRDVGGPWSVGVGGAGGEEVLALFVELVGMEGSIEEALLALDDDCLVWVKDGEDEDAEGNAEDELG
jgi:hypothetical protein